MELFRRVGNFYTSIRWRRLFLRRRVLGLSAVATFILLLITVCALLLYTNRELSGWGAELGAYPINKDMLQLNGTGPGVGFLITATGSDFLSGGSVNLIWFPVGCNQTAMPIFNIYPDILPKKWPPPEANAGCGGLPQSMDVWVNQNPSWSWNASALPYNRKNATLVDLRPIVTFTTNHTTDTASLNSFTTVSYSATYPFDASNFGTLIEAFDSATGSPLPIYFTMFTGGVTGYNVVLSREVVTTPRTEYGVWLVLRITRQKTVKIFVVFLFIIIYGLMLGMVYITIAALVGKYRLPSEVLLLPLTNFLALPQLRSSMPDAPSFGVFYDIWGYDLSLICVALCAVVLVWALVRSGQREQRDSLRELTDSKDAVAPEEVDPFVLEKV